MKLPDKSLMVDSTGRPLTQSLFLEAGYSDFAIYTFKEQDHEKDGKHYPSIRRLYIEEGDPTEYIFANKYFLGWNHWQRICNNKQLAKEIAEWRNELELKMQAEALQEIVAKSMEDGGTGLQAAKYLADKGWIKNGKGRPKKDTSIEEESEQKLRLADFSADVKRMQDYRSK